MHAHRTFDVYLFSFLLSDSPINLAEVWHVGKADVQICRSTIQQVSPFLWQANFTDGCLLAGKIFLQEEEMGSKG